MVDIIRFMFGTIFIIIIGFTLFYIFGKFFTELTKINKKRDDRHDNNWRYKYNTEFLELLHRKGFLSKADYEGLENDLKKRLK